MRESSLHEEKLEELLNKKAEVLIYAVAEVVGIPGSLASIGVSRFIGLPREKKIEIFKRIVKELCGVKQ